MIFKKITLSLLISFPIISIGNEIEWEPLEKDSSLTLVQKSATTNSSVRVELITDLNDSDSGCWKENSIDEYSNMKKGPESKQTCLINGNFVFDVPGRSGMGIHSGRSGPQSKTLGCVRTTDEATDFLRTLHGTDPLQTITVQ